MADWYVSSVAWAALPKFAASTAYTVGQIIQPLTAQTFGHEYAFRCTTAGTSGAEPGSWPGNNTGTVTSGGATFTNVSGQSAYGWSAPAGTLYAISNAVANRPATGDRVFVSSDHSETNTGFTSYSFAGGSYGIVKLFSVNRAGSVPPVVADIQSGATIIQTGGSGLRIDPTADVFYQGFTFSTPVNHNFGVNGTKTIYLKDCAIVLTTGATTISTLIACKMMWDNVTVQFSSASQGFNGPNSGATLDLTWVNTPNAIKGTMPTNLFSASASGYSTQVTLRGVDLSAFSGTLMATPGWWNGKLLLDSCRINPAMTRLSGSTGTVDGVELVNCYDGTNYVNERYSPAGSLITDRSTTLSNGAADDVGAYSLKLASNANSSLFGTSDDCFAFDVENIAVGVSKTATVEVISSAALNNTDISLSLEYLDLNIASFASSLASALTASSALPSSSKTWNNPPATPQKQLLQATFTPQRAGRVRGLVQLGKASTNVWVNPQITIT